MHQVSNSTRLDSFIIPLVRAKQTLCEEHSSFICAKKAPPDVASNPVVQRDLWKQEEIL